MPKPNIILIIADQLRADALGFNNPLVHTPNIDSIQQHACTFENAFCASPVCTPSRAAILTGRYPSCTGAWNIGTSLNEEEQTLPDYLKDSGYFNVGVGKMHLRPQLKALDPKDPESLEIRDRVRDRDQTYYGFDKVIITEDDKIGLYNDYVLSHNYHSNIGIGDEGKGSDGVNDIPEELHQTYWIGKHSCDEISNHDFESPLFLWSSFVDPHHPFDPIKKFADLYKNTEIPNKISMGNIEEHRPAHLMSQQGKYWPGGGEKHSHSDEHIKELTRYYYGMISFIDQEIGKIISTLKEKGQWGNTLLIITSDHGEFMGDHGLLQKGPFMYDSIIKVPLIFHGCGITTSSIEGMVENVDILPSILDFLGEEVPVSVQGVSLNASLKKGEESPRDSAVITYDAHDRSIMAKTYRTKEFKLTIFMNEEYGELFDLTKDPQETTNLFFNKEYENIKNTLVFQLLQRILKDYDPLPLRTALW